MAQPQAGRWIKGSFFNAKNYFDSTGSCQKLIKSSIYKAEDKIEQGYKPNQGGNGVLFQWKNKPLAFYDVPTLNDMIFSKKLWNKIHENPFIKAALDNHCFWGEDQHRDNSEVLFENVTIRVDDFHCDENNIVCGDVSLMDTPRGLIIYALAKTGAIGTSSRGFGDLFDRNTQHIVDKTHPQTGLVDVVEDAYLAVDWDCVTFPAVPNAMCLYTNEEQPNLTQSIQDLEKGLREKITSCIQEAYEKNPLDSWISTMFNSLNLADKQSKTFILNENNVKSVFKKSYPNIAQIASAFKRGE